MQDDSPYRIVGNERGIVISQARTPVDSGANEAELPAEIEDMTCPVFVLSQVMT
jgi:hypothetical protein